MSDATGISRVELVDLVDDGMTDEEIAEHTQAWLRELKQAPIVDLGVSAADVLDQLYADGEL
ncbi:MAG: hypothetical protein WKF60_13610 [Ilumatobacter sp.]|jgi:hypothetical protein